MKRAQFDKESLLLVISEVPKVLKNLDNIIDRNNEKIDTAEGRYCRRKL